MKQADKRMRATSGPRELGADGLLALVARQAQVGQLKQALAQPGRRRLRVGGLQGSAPAVALAATRHPGTLLLVGDDAEEAAQWLSDLRQLRGRERVALLPSAFRRALHDTEGELLRAELLCRLQAGEEGLWVVTYPEALAEGVPAGGMGSERAFTITVGQEWDFGDLEERMEGLDFERVDYVAEPGQFALRGSIVDVFSCCSEQPWRVDFFGDQVDSIRPFDPATQLSQGALGEGAQIVVAARAAEQGTTLMPALDAFPEETWIVCRDEALLRERVAQVVAQGEDADRAVSPQALGNSMDRLRCACLCQAGEGDVQFDTSPQPLFHKRFDWLETQCRQWMEQGLSICFVADNPKQLQRIRDIFDAHGADIPFTPVCAALHEGYVDRGAGWCVLTDHQVFDRFHRCDLATDGVRRAKAALSLKQLQQLQPGDFVVHIDHGIGQFEGLVNVPTEQGATQEMIKIRYAGGGTLFVSIHSLHKIAKYRGQEGTAPRLSRLGGGAWQRMKERVKGRVKDIAGDLIRLYAKRMRTKGFAFAADSYMQHELEASFLYEDTPDQLRATMDVKRDMEAPRPMDRLVCGDVGFGKTEIAIRAAVKAAADGKQTAVLVPTTILAYQHAQTFCERLRDFPVRVDYLSRARTPAEAKDTLKALAEGQVDILIGTQRLLGKDVHFKDLGLLVIDEEQKFGVAVKEKLRQLKANIDTLTLTATPIPRTLQFSLMGARDLSILQTPPANRLPIRTELLTFDPQAIAEAVRLELARNGQVFFVNNRVENLPQMEMLLHEWVPEARVGVAHGQMDPKTLEKNVLDFINQDYDVLLATTIVENGIDVPNANTIIINAAQHYGLADLHQMRGRVGRSNKRAFCYLIAPPLAALPSDARRRLQAICNSAELGVGFHIAMQDLDIRGAGNLLGREQSGFVADLGYETYQQVLAEAVAELKGAADLAAGTDAPTNGGSTPGAAGEVVVETDIPAFFPETFVPTSEERISLYRELDQLAHPEQLKAYRARLRDRFGQTPPEAEELLRIIPLKWTAARIGAQRLILKRRQMILHLPIDTTSRYYQSSAFGAIIHYATHNAQQCQLKEKPAPALVVRGVGTVEQALNILQEMLPDQHAQ